MTVYLDNAAGRLHKLIIDFRSSALNNNSIPQAWAAALSVKDIANPDFLRRLAYVFRLPGEIEHEMAKIDEQEYDPDLALRWRGAIRSGVGTASLFSGLPAGQPAANMDDAVLGSLEHCSYVLHRYRPQRVLSKTELDGINELISELITEIQENEDAMDPSLRDFLFFHASEMMHALSDLTLRGPAALEEALDQAVGAGQRRVDLTVRLETEANSGGWTKFLNLLVGVAAVLQIASTSLMLPGQVRQELEGPAPAQASVVKVVPTPDLGPAQAAANGHQHGGDKAAEGRGSN